MLWYLVSQGQGWSKTSHICIGVCKQSSIQYQVKQYPAQIVFGAKVEKYLCAANLCSMGHGVHHVSGTGEKHHGVLRAALGDSHCWRPPAGYW